MKHGEEPNCAKPSGFVASAMAALGLSPRAKEDQAEGSVRVHLAPLKTSTPQPKASLNPNQLDEGWYAGFLKPVMRPSLMLAVKSREPAMAVRTAGGTEAPDKAEAAVARLTEADDTGPTGDPEGQDASASGRENEAKNISKDSNPSIEYATQPAAAEGGASAPTKASGAAPAEAGGLEDAPALPQAAAAEPVMGAGASAAAAPAAVRPSGKPRWERAERAAQAAQLGGGATLPLSARDAAAQARRNSALVSELRQHLESSGPRPSTYAVRPCMQCPSAVLPLPA